ncbi:MAG TPA: ABC transporter permease, partial [Baekduia sp.]
MLRLIVAELRHRRGRALALLAGIAVATVSFTVLTGASESSRLEVTGNVGQHFRTAYDILVRPPGAVQGLERTKGLVQQNYLAGSFGGITMKQLRTVAKVPGVDVAAPLAVYGYLMPQATIPVSVAGHLSPGTRSAFRVKTRWVADRGGLQIQDADSYIYATRRPLAAGPPHVDASPLRYRGTERLADGTDAPVCVTPSEAVSPFSRAARSWLWCWSTKTGLAGPDGVEQPPGGVGAEIAFPFPLLIAGIDPVAEAKLSGTDRAVVSGRYFRPGEGTRKTNPGWPTQTAPVLAAVDPDVDLHANIAISRLPASTATTVATAGADRAAVRDALDDPPGTPLLHRTITADQAYAALLHQLRSGPQTILQRWTAGPAHDVATGPAHVRAVPVKTDPYMWGADFSTAGTGAWFIPAPATAHDDGFRKLTEFVAGSERRLKFTPQYQVVGTFDVRKLAGALNPDVAPLNPFQPPGSPAADPAAAPWLHGQDLAPDGNMASYQSPPPMLLTTIGARSTFLDPAVYSHDSTAQSNAPVSVIRVRVKGVTGADATSRERVRLTAERIAHATGLQVDVTAGSSPTPVDVDLAASPLGRPAVTLREGWIKKGVATTILDAVDHKSQVLFLLVLLVCALFCINATSAAVRTRATELGILACVGWPTRKLFTYLLTEVGLVGLAAGVVGTLVALPVGAALGLPVSGSRALLAVPAATALALVAGLVPAARAARSDPLEAVRPAVRRVRSAHAVRSIAGLATNNLLRVPGRTALGATSLGVGIFALTLLLAVTIAFRGAVVGSVLGDAVSVQVRTADYVAVGATLVLGALACADVLYLNLRDRSAEIATLRATGWRERQLTRLVAVEGTGLGALGGVVGAVLGFAAAGVFTGEWTFTMVLVALGAAALGVLIATAASIAPAAGLRRLPTAT